jgi:hypothetical protein
MEVCSLSIEAKKSTRFCWFCCFCCCGAVVVTTDCCRFPVSELKGFVGSGRATISLFLRVHTRLCGFCFCRVRL